MAPAWAERLERRFGSWSIPNLATYIAGMNAAVWALSMLNPEFPRLLALEPAAVRSGELWRLFTFLFIPPQSIGPLLMFFWITLLFTYARALESRWGEFHFNVYYALGGLSTIAASLYLGHGLSNVSLNTSLFLAFAALYPDFEILLFFILPVKVRWLAWFAWTGMAWAFWVGGFSSRVALGAGVLNYLAFFGPEHLADLRLRLDARRRRRAFRGSV